MKKVMMTVFCWLLAAGALTAPAYAQELVLGGQAVGVQISTEGVLVAELSEVETSDGVHSPAKEAGVCRGDLIVKAGGNEVGKAAEIIELVEKLDGASVALTVRRAGSLMNFEVTPRLSAEGQWMLGLWLRDGISGLGTLTFVEPESGTYGALGHSINDSDTGSSLPVAKGSITDAQIVGVTPGAAGKPGELNGCADLERKLGNIELNTERGIFGTLYYGFEGKVMDSGVITAGPATIVSTVSGRESGEYQVEINRVYKDSEGVHAMLSVTDPTLLSKTGGIVQGMSGSPIVQNGKLVGAVTHVFISDPTRGYAISIQDMLKAAGIEDKAA